MTTWTKVGPDHWRAKTAGQTCVEVWLAGGESPWVHDGYVSPEPIGPPLESGDVDTIEEAKAAALAWATRHVAGTQIEMTEARV